MGTLEKRIETLENKILLDVENQTEGVFYYTVDARKEAPPIDEQLKKPVIGWVCFRGNDEIRIIRREGETNDELNARAISEVKPLLTHPLAVPVFHSINEDEQD